MVAFTVDVELPRVPLLQRGRAVQLLRQNHNRFIVRALEVMSSRAKVNTRVGGTGLLRGTIFTDFAFGTQQDVRGRVVWAQPYAQFVDEGTSPHFPPIAPLKRWARRVLGDESAAFAVQQKIGVSGTDPQKFSERTFVETEPQIERLYRQAIDRYARELLG